MMSGPRLQGAPGLGDMGPWPPVVSSDPIGPPLCFVIIHLCPGRKCCAMPQLLGSDINLAWFSASKQLTLVAVCHRSILFLHQGKQWRMRCFHMSPIHNELSHSNLPLFLVSVLVQEQHKVTHPFIRRVRVTQWKVGEYVSRPSTSSKFWSNLSSCTLDSGRLVNPLAVHQLSANLNQRLSSSTREISRL